MKISGKNVVITGGAGFIGSHIAESLVKIGANVTIFDNFSSGRQGNLNGSRNSMNIVKGNVLNYNSLRGVLRNADIVSHQAAQLEIFRCISDPENDLKTNTIGTLNVLRACEADNVKMMINASSACVYGQGNGHGSSDEDDFKRPNWAYGISKLAAEKYCELYQANTGMPVASLRYGIVYGEREWFGRVLTIFIRRLLEKKPLVVFGNGKQVRDFIHVDDVVRFHNLAIEKELSGPYNVATGKGTTINALAKMVGDSVLHEDLEEGKESRNVPGRRRIPQELNRMVLDIWKAKELGWKPEVSLEDGINREIEWAMSHKNAWETKRGMIRV